MPAGPTPLRHGQPWPRLALRAVLLLAVFAGPVHGLPDALPARITRPTELPELPSAITAIDNARITAESNGPVMMNSQAGHELRRRHRHLQRGEKEDTSEQSTGSTGDHKTSKETNGGSKTKTAAEASGTGSGQDDSDSKTTEAPTKSMSDDLDLGMVTTETTAQTAVSTSIESDGSSTPLPVPFDETPSSDFESSDDSSCPSFISSLLSSSQFNDCYPVSMLVMTSAAFFDAKRELTSMVRVLDASCAADVDSCANFMTEAAQNLTAKENCQKEYQEGNSSVLEAYNGLLNYQLMYTATCLQNSDTDQYCYASAVTNTTTTSDSYLYYLPYNLSLPASATPSCSSCNQNTMEVFRAATANRDLLIAETYVDAAIIVDNWCDRDFANATLSDASVSWGLTVLPQWTALAAVTLFTGALGVST